MQTTSRLPHRPHRRGFTLIELLTVIAILSILMAFLLPAVMNTQRTARIAQVKTEIGNIAAAIATFKQEFGVEPPSSITLQASGGTWDTNSRAIITRMWPQFNFSTSGGAGWASAVTLDGAECLVFFLGGVPASGAPSGFSRNPAAPFATGTGNRLNPFYQFDPARLIDLDGDGFFEFRDPLNASTAAPYVYFSSYDGSGYPTEMNSGVWRNVDNSGRIQRAYYQSVTGDAAANAATSKPYNPSGYQLISAGFDGQHGPGGLYQPDATTKLPAWGSYTAADRLVEGDNISNIGNGVLAP